MENVAQHEKEKTVVISLRVEAWRLKRWKAAAVTAGCTVSKLLRDGGDYEASVLSAQQAWRETR